MRILHAHKFHYYRAGAERYMFDLIDIQRQDGHDVAVFSMHHPQNLPSPWSDFFVRELKTDVPVPWWYRFKQIGRSFYSFEAKRKFTVLLDAFDPDIVHVHNIYTHISPSILRVCKKRGISVVMSVHDYALVSANYSLWNIDTPMDLQYLGIWATAKTRFIGNSFTATFLLECIYRVHKMLGWYSRPIARFFANSHFMLERLVQAGISKRICSVLYPMITWPMQERYADDGYVLYMGRLDVYKGVHILLEAMKAFPHVTLKIAGTGPYEQELRAQAKDMKQVEFLGFLSGQAREDVLRQARVCVVPSVWHEPFGLVAVEAMARMTPVIVSKVGGLQEIVEPGVSGEVVVPGESSELAKALKPFLCDPKHAKRYAQSALDRARELCDPGTHYKNVMGQYADVLDDSELK